MERHLLLAARATIPQARARSAGTSYWRGVAWRNDCKTQFTAACFAPEFLLDQLRIVELAPSKVQISSQSKSRNAQKADGRQGDRAPIAALPCGPRVQSHGSGRGQHHDRHKAGQR